MQEGLIESFRIGHQAIVDLLERIQGTARSYPAAKPHIRALATTLVTHFGRQDNRLFEDLRFFYREDRQSSKLLEFVVHDLKDIKIKYLIFFDKHSGELADLGSPTFPRNFTDFSKDILARIKIEEEYLLPLIEKMASSNQGL